MILLTPIQAKNLLDNLDNVAPTFGYPTSRAVFVRMVDNEMVGARLETLVTYLASGNDETVILSDAFNPSVPGMKAKLSLAGVEGIAHPGGKVTYYRLGRARLLRQLGIALHISDNAAICLLSKPQHLPYSDYLTSPQWEVKRRAAVERAGNACQKCGRRNCRLEVHHISYVRMGQERPEDLIVVCPPCHAELDRKSGFGKGRTKAVKHG